MSIYFDCYPGGKHKAVTFSYDDIDRADLQMLEIMERYGAKCTINVNTSWFGQEWQPGVKRLTEEEVKDVGTRHELACHGLRHRWMNLENECYPKGSTVRELWEDKMALEAIAGKPVIGMAYPYGTQAVNEDIRHLLGSCGLLYARGTEATGEFDLPRDFTCWEPTCHHRDGVDAAERFLNYPGWKPPLPLLYIWGHSYEYRWDNNFELLEEILEKLSACDDIWYATNGEVYEYCMALRNLRVSADEKTVYNPSCISVFATVDGVITELRSGLNQL